MKSLKFTILILSFLAVSAAVSGCAWRLGRKPVNPPVTENENQPSENPKSEIKNQKSEIINTDDWLTYRNEEYGFEVKYPEGWSINGMLLQNQTDRNQEIFLEVYEGNLQELDIYSWINEQQWPSPESLDDQFYIFNYMHGIEAYEQKQTGTVYFTYGKNIFIIDNGVSMRRRVVDEKLFNKILSTFRFLN